MVGIKDNLFHPLISEWFESSFASPTDIQAEAWPVIAEGRNTLISAPTGSGKTLTAFLWALNQLITGRLPVGVTSVLYVSPLKALNNDIRRNLLSPLNELGGLFSQKGVQFPDINVSTRSGDTSSADRRRMIKHPPEILITTPESLNLLLSSHGGRSILTSIRCVILDEIHALIDNKRGAHLITAVDRLVPLSGDFQRIALSATIRPMDLVAEFVGGSILTGSPESPCYKPRDVIFISSGIPKKYNIQVKFPVEEHDLQTSDSIWDPLTIEFKKIIQRNRSTLLFTNNRRLCEKITYKINADEERPVAYSHHGSLSKEIRKEVETRLKSGELRAIVATSSLEMGIDIGSLDEVLLIQSPPSISSAIQRIGRAGHQVGEVSKGALFPSHSQDFLESAVLAKCILERDIEAFKPVENALDILAQIIVSMTGVETWDIDELYALIKTSYPYRNLMRRHFDLVMDMLAGRYDEAKIRELTPKISIDRLENTAKARKGALQTLYMSGGVIPNRGYYHLRHTDTGSRIGELDEEFVWEARIGQILTLGAQNWKIEKITHNDVFVKPANPNALDAPFWRAEEYNRDFHFSRRIAEFLERIQDLLENDRLPDILMEEYKMDDRAAKELILFLRRQKAETGPSLPHRGNLLIEHISSGPGGVPGNQVVLHTLWGLRVNRPYAMALEAAWEKKFKQKLEIFPGNDSIALLVPNDIRSDELISMVNLANFDSLIRLTLENSGFFGARFREAAQRTLLLSRPRINERLPLWMSRLKAQKLFHAVKNFNDFPVLLEAWRTCMQDDFDLDSLKNVLAELETGVIEWSEVKTSHPSPMARTLTWRQINQYMYMTDSPSTGDQSNLSMDLLREVVFNPGLRPAVSGDLISNYTLKRQRLSPGYSPSDYFELLDWIKERLVLPEPEWNELLKAIERDHGTDPSSWFESIAHKIVFLKPGGLGGRLIVALENVHKVISSLYGDESDLQFFSLDHNVISELPVFRPESENNGGDDAASLLGEWLQYYGPISPKAISTRLGIPAYKLDNALEDLIAEQVVISGDLVEGSREPTVCDSENFETLLRMTRASALPVFEARPVHELARFLALHQNLGDDSDNDDAIYESIERLSHIPLPAAMWEYEVLPARLNNYSTSRLDSVMRQSDLLWIGAENRRVFFTSEMDLDLAVGDDANDSTPDETEPEGTKHDACEERLSRLFPDPNAKYDFPALLRNAKSSTSELPETLWNAVWEGRISNDEFSALRRAVENNFKSTHEQSTPAFKSKSRRSRPGRRGGVPKLRPASPYPGSWFRLPSVPLPDGLIEIEEKRKDRVRVLLDRYGILFRELLLREAPPFRWASVFRSLRLMELSGEVLAGLFFKGIPGPQFMSHSAFRKFQRNTPDDFIFWINAADPLSLCGLPLEDLKGTLPKRNDKTHIVYRGADIVMVSEKSGKKLTFNIAPDDPGLHKIIVPLRHLLERSFMPVKRITVEEINGEPASGSEFADVFKTCFHALSEYKNLILYSRTI